MKAKYEDLDIEFSNVDYNLYIVFDNTTNADVSGIIPGANDLVAIGSFVEFMDSQKDKIKPYSEYILRFIGRYDSMNHKLNNGETIDIISSKENVKEYYDGLINYYNKFHEEE